jgi:hypothetical protein
MEQLSRATSKTYKMPTTAHAGFNLKHVQTAVATAPPFPRQITLVGELSDTYALIQPLELEFESDEDGGFVASEDVFFIYGSGRTRVEAVNDYVKSLCEYYELLSQQTDVPTVELFNFVSSYVRPRNR